MRKRIFLWACLGVLLTIGVAFALPASRYPLLGLFGIEQLYHGRPVRYWVSAIKDDDPAVRSQAALALGDAAVGKDASDADEEGLAVLITALADSDAYVRKCAATSLLIYPKDTVVPKDHASVGAMISALRDDQVAVRQAAVRGLWQAGPAAAQGDSVQRLTAALNDADVFVRAYACRALARIGPDAKDAVPGLLRHLREDEDRDIRKLAAKSLGLIGPRSVGSLLPDAAKALSASLKDDLRGLREYAARALGQLGATDAIPALREAARDRDAGVRAAATESLRLLEAKAAAP